MHDKWKWDSLHVVANGGAFLLAASFIRAHLEDSFDPVLWWATRLGAGALEIIGVLLLFVAWIAHFRQKRMQTSAHTAFIGGMMLLGMAMNHLATLDDMKLYLATFCGVLVTFVVATGASVALAESKNSRRRINP